MVLLYSLMHRVYETKGDSLRLKVRDMLRHRGFCVWCALWPSSIPLN